MGSQVVSFEQSSSLVQGAKGTQVPCEQTSAAGHGSAQSTLPPPPVPAPTLIEPPVPLAALAEPAAPLDAPLSPEPPQPCPAAAMTPSAPNAAKMTLLRLRIELAMVASYSK
jgi:hypothetical protein